MNIKGFNLRNVKIGAILLSLALVISAFSFYASADSSLADDFPVISNNYLRGVKEGLTSIKLHKNYTDALHGCSYDLYDIDGNYISNANIAHIVSTGDYIIDGKRNTYTVVVTGDIDGNGKVNIADTAVIKAHFAKTITLDGAAYEAADTNNDGRVAATDYIRIKYHIQSKYDIHDNESFSPDESIPDPDTGYDENNWTSGWM